VNRVHFAGHDPLASNRDAVFGPTPGFTKSAPELFFAAPRESTWISGGISLSRPITGQSKPGPAPAVRSTAVLLQGGRFPAPGSVTATPDPPLSPSLGAAGAEETGRKWCARDVVDRLGRGSRAGRRWGCRSTFGHGR